MCGTSLRRDESKRVLCFVFLTFFRNPTGYIPSLSQPPGYRLTWYPVPNPNSTSAPSAALHSLSLTQLRAFEFKLKPRLTTTTTQPTTASSLEHTDPRLLTTPGKGSQVWDRPLTVTRSPGAHHWQAS